MSLNSCSRTRSFHKIADDYKLAFPWRGRCPTGADEVESVGIEVKSFNDSHNYILGFYRADAVDQLHLMRRLLVTLYN